MLRIIYIEKLKGKRLRRIIILAILGIAVIYVLRFFHPFQGFVWRKQQKVSAIHKWLS